MKTSLILIALIIVASCDYYDNRLEIVNRTDAAIAVQTYSAEIPTEPETNGTGYHLNNAIEPGERQRLIAMGSTKEWPFKIERSENKKLNLVVFNIDSLTAHQNIDSLLTRRVYRSYHFTEDEMNRTNWQVIIK